jgi:hypothetical protein
MKVILYYFILNLLILSSAHAQTFFVEKTKKGYESKILEKLKYDGYKVFEQKETSDYTIVCLITQTSKINSMYKGYLKIEDSKSGKEISRSKEVRRGAVAANGFNAANNIFQVIADKQLIQLIEPLKK